MRTLLDEAGLVYVAAAATGTRPDEVLATCDVAALASVAAALEGVTSGLDAAAVALGELGRRRPFARGNTAAAWLAAAHLLAVDDRRLVIGPAAAVAVLGAAAELGPGEIAVVLRERTEPRATTVRRLVQRLVGRRPLAGPGVFACPACGRTLVQRRHDLVAAGPWAEAARMERVARCAVENGGHDRRAAARPASVVGA
jgi:hypothetical protein